MAEAKRISPPLTEAMLQGLKAGDRILISGVLYTARDVAHARLAEAINEGKQLPFDLQGQIMYYVGPTPPGKGKPVGSAGPTTSTRMDAYTPTLLSAGLKGMIGKGPRSAKVIEAIKKYKAVYLAATGGAGALLSKRIKSLEIIAYKELGAEAIRRLEVEDFPVVVINDIYGNDLYQSARKEYAKPSEYLTGID